MGSSRKGIWSTEEHDRFLDAITHYPQGPWIALAKYVGTRSARQVQTHAQKYYEKIARHLRGLQRDRKPTGGNEHRIEERILSLLVLGADKAAEVEKQFKSAKTTRRSGAGVSPHQEQSSVNGGSTPPCLQRLQELPASPVSVDALANTSSLSVDAALTVSCGDHNGPLDESSLPSLEQSLDFFIDLLSSPVESWTPYESLAA